MKITPTQLNKTQPLTTSQNQEQRTQIQETKSGSKIAEKTPVSSAIRDAQLTLSQMPDVDMEKVEAIKAALQDGKIKVNVEELADAMKKYYRG